MNMIALWTSTAKMTPMLLLNGTMARNSLTAGVLNAISKPLPYGAGYPVQSVLSREPYNQACNKILLYNGKTLFISQPSSMGLRFYSANSSGSLPPTPTPTPPNLPDKEQIERVFFRVVAFVWDFGSWLFAWSRKMLKMHVVDNPSVKFYWKRFHDKMEEAKKDT